MHVGTSETFCLVDCTNTAPLARNMTSCSETLYQTSTDLSADSSLMICRKSGLDSWRRGRTLTCSRTRTTTRSEENGTCTCYNLSRHGKQYRQYSRPTAPRTRSPEPGHCSPRIDGQYSPPAHGRTCRTSEHVIGGKKTHCGCTKSKMEDVQTEEGRSGCTNQPGRATRFLSGTPSKTPRRRQEEMGEGEGWQEEITAGRIAMLREY